MEAVIPTNSFAQREFFRLNSITEQPKTTNDLARLHPTAARPENYASKNRYGDVLPLEKERVRLRYEELRKRNEVESDYINASLVGPTHLQFICAQAPLPSTFIDFWQMVWEQVRCLDLPLIFSDPNCP
jgi:protein tyrosine phosphatase